MSKQHTLTVHQSAPMLELPTEILAYILRQTTKARFKACQTCRCLASIIHDIVGYDSVTISSVEQAEVLLKHSSTLRHTKIRILPIYEGTLTRFAGVHTIDLRECKVITNEDLKSLSGVHTICLSWCEGITDEGIKSLSGVHSINLSGCGGITDEGIKSLSGVHSIYLRWCQGITDESIKSLLGVHTIDVSHCYEGITYEGMKSLLGVHKIIRDKLSGLDFRQKP